MRVNVSLSNSLLPFDPIFPANNDSQRAFLFATTKHRVTNNMSVRWTRTFHILFITVSFLNIFI